MTRTERSDQQLPLDEQRRLAFARLLLHAPRWVMVDEAISALGHSHRRLVLSLYDRELVGATLIRLGRDPVLTASGTGRCASSIGLAGPACAPACCLGRGGSRFAHRFKPELGRWQHS